MKVREAIRLIQDDGWYLDRTKGSHRQFKHATKPSLVTVPGNMGDEIAPGTLKTSRSQIMKYLVILGKTNTGYSAYSPDLPGCISTGHSREETEANMQEAIEFHIEGLQLAGFPVPEPISESAYVELAA